MYDRSRAYAKRYKVNRFTTQLVTATPTLIFNRNANRVGLSVSIAPDATGAILDGVTVGPLVGGAVRGLIGATRSVSVDRLSYDDIGGELCEEIWATAAFATVFSCTIIEVIDTGNE